MCSQQVRAWPRRVISPLHRATCVRRLVDWAGGGPAHQTPTRRRRSPLTDNDLMLRHRWLAADLVDAQDAAAHDLPSGPGRGGPAHRAARRVPARADAVELGQGLGADPAAGPAVRRVDVGAVAQAALALPRRALSTADVHRAGGAGTGRDANHDPAAQGAGGGRGGRARSVRGRRGPRGVVANGATRGGGPRCGRACRARADRGAGYGRDPVRSPAVAARRAP